MTTESTCISPISNLRTRTKYALSTSDTLAGKTLDVCRVFVNEVILAHERRIQAQNIFCAGVDLKAARNSVYAAFHDWVPLRNENGTAVPLPRYRNVWPS